MRNTWLQIAPFIITAFVSACGGAAETGQVGDEIIGGSGAAAARFDAVGTIGNVDPATGKYEYYCSATLVSPTMILTARHCAISNLPVAGPHPTTVRVSPTYFAIGPNAKRPRCLVQVASAAYAEPAPEGWLGGPAEFGLGHDVAVMTLAEPVLDIAPVAVSALAPAPGMILTNVGFGVSSLETHRDGLRKRLDVEVDALSGAPAQIIFGTFAAYLAAGESIGNDEALIRQAPDRLRRDFSRPMSAFEVYAGKVASEQGGNSCKGDSGGPLLDLSIPTRPVVMGVTSGGLGCDFGGTYARVDRPATRRLLSSDACAHIPSGGDCSGSFLVTCEGMDGRPRLVDCAKSGQSCTLNAMGGASCGDVAWAPTFPTCSFRRPVDVPVTMTATTGTPPAPRGGNIQDGTWVLSSHVFYDKEGDDIGPGTFVGNLVAFAPPERNTLYVSHARIQMAESDDTFISPLSWYQGHQTYRPEVVAARGYVLRMECPLHQSFEYGVTATPNSIDFYDYWGRNLISVARYVRAPSGAPFYDPPPNTSRGLAPLLGLARCYCTGLLRPQA